MCVYTYMFMYIQSANWFDSNSLMNNPLPPNTPKFSEQRSEGTVSMTSTASFAKHQHFRVLLKLAYETQISLVRFFKNLSCMEQNKQRKVILSNRKAQQF